MRKLYFSLLLLPYSSHNSSPFRFFCSAFIQLRVSRKDTIHNPIIPSDTETWYWTEAKCKAKSVDGWGERRRCERICRVVIAALFLNGVSQSFAWMQRRPCCSYCGPKWEQARGATSRHCCNAEVMSAVNRRCMTTVICSRLMNAVGTLSGKVPDLYSVGYWFESQLVHAH